MVKPSADRRNLEERMEITKAEADEKRAESLKKGDKA